MDIVQARNVNDAYHKGVELICSKGLRGASRAGDVLVMQNPVTTVYEKPYERVLFDPERDANPFFHIMEALWMLAGQRDARWLDQFVGDFSQRFAEEDGMQHGAYGYRWRKHFDMDGGGYVGMPDQLNTLVDLLKRDPGTRQAVLAMWDPTADLGQKKKDLPCNTHVYFRIRQEPTVRGGDLTSDYALDITVCCRSNDIIWGAYGANAVHFSVLQEYIAARVGVAIGRYYQISNNYHVYFDVLKQIKSTSPDGSYGRELQDPLRVYWTPLVDAPEAFDADLQTFFSTSVGSQRLMGAAYKNRAFPEIVLPMYRAYALWRAKQREEARKIIDQMPTHSDWRGACLNWMDRRLNKVKVNEPATTS